LESRGGDFDLGLSDGGGFVGCGARVCDVGEGVREAYGVAIVALPLSKVSGVFVGPGGAVHGTVLAQCRLAVQTQDISVDKLAGLDWTAIGWWVGKVVHILCVAGFGAESCVEGT